MGGEMVDEAKDGDSGGGGISGCDSGEVASGGRQVHELTLGGIAFDSGGCVTYPRLHPEDDIRKVLAHLRSLFLSSDGLSDANSSSQDQNQNQNWDYPEHFDVLSTISTRLSKDKKRFYKGLSRSVKLVMEGLQIPGLDGIVAVVYWKYQYFLGDGVTMSVMAFLNSEHMLREVLSEKYCSNLNLLEVKPLAGCSWGWRSVLWGRDLLVKWLKCFVGNGDSINAFKGQVDVLWAIWLRRNKVQFDNLHRLPVETLRIVMELLSSTPLFHNQDDSDTVVKEDLTILFGCQVISFSNPSVMPSQMERFQVTIHGAWSSNYWQADAAWVVRDSNGILRGQSALQLMTSSATTAEFKACFVVLK
ncbi:hypothetical protein Acr_07g0011900 [Actinidia rufa]|uniref:Uncharacterized protein n=1 Tax=Actinidia rufa TaxID=165716 RepID=A0A7J0EWZ5_9ERIC|nr:hypothetical protein Acr_07g0011900 [Actinidia rufa]